MRRRLSYRVCRGVGGRCVCVCDSRPACVCTRLSVFCAGQWLKNVMEAFDYPMCDYDIDAQAFFTEAEVSTFATQFAIAIPGLIPYYIAREREFG